MKYIIFNSPQLMLNFLLDVGISISKLRQCMYYSDITREHYTVKCEEIFTSNDIENYKKLLEIYIVRYDKESVQISSNEKLLYEKNSIDELLQKQKLIPSSEDENRSYSKLIFFCVGEESFRKTIDILFKLAIVKIYAAKAQYGDDESFLVLASDIESPTALAKLLHINNVTIFYPAHLFFGIWVEWGCRYEFNNPAFYRILKDSDAESVFIHKNGKRLPISITHQDFVPIIKFMKLRFSRRAQTTPITLLEYKPQEFRYTLHLKKDSLWMGARQEIEELIQQEKEIRERIEWLSNIESIFKETLTYKIFFYRYGEKQKDPIFPHSLIRDLSLYRLREFKVYYGKVGTLGEGVLLCYKNVIEKKIQDIYELPNRLYPRNGLIFQNNPHWQMAGLRVLTPLGYDLFPYLEVLQDDQRAIVNAFIDEAVWGIKREQGKSIREASQEYLKEQSNKIKETPEKFLYFIFPRIDSMGMDWEKSSLEAVVIHENAFIDFEVKIANLGIYFTMNDEEKDLAKETFKTTIVRDISNRFQGSLDILKGHLERSFNKERESLKQKIENFVKSIDQKVQNIKTLEKILNESLLKIREKENAISSYDTFISRLLNEYVSLLKDGAKASKKFIGEIGYIINQMIEDIDDIVKNNLQEQTEIIKNMKETQTRAQDIEGKIKIFIKKKKRFSQNLSLLQEKQDKFIAKFNVPEWKKLQLEETITQLWKINDANEGLKIFLSTMEEHLKKLKSTSMHLNIYTDFPNYDFVSDCFDDLSKRINTIKSLWKSERNDDGDEVLSLLKDFEIPVDNCLKDIEKSIRHLKSLEKNRSEKDFVKQKILEYIRSVMRKIQSILSH